MAYRIIQWSTGNAGRWALRAAIQSPDLDVVGVWVHSPQKAGVDGGTLAGVDPVGCGGDQRHGPAPGPRCRRGLLHRGR